MFKQTKSSTQSAFTIVELLVVIVVIGTLATLVIISYSGIQQRAKIASLQSDLTGASQQLRLYQVSDINGNYPDSLDGSKCFVPAGADNMCLKASSDNSFTSYSANNTTNPKTFTLNAVNGDLTYKITNDSIPTLALSCPTGFIVVPGSATYGTSDFCIMKYEAKNTGTATSQAAGLPWSVINQSTAINRANEACTGCHLVTEAEWLTVAQNVLSVNSNWSGGTVGSGYIYIGHSDQTPNTQLAADTDDNNGYFGTSNFAGDSTVTWGTTGDSQRRTLTLTNGEVIWDLAGNVFEWTSGTNTIRKPGVIGAGWAVREWTAITYPGTLAIDPSPSATGISGANTWTTANGIGNIYSSYEDTTLRGFLRSGGWGSATGSGVLYLGLNNAPSYPGTYIGFRVAK
ncbi:MAG: prepilin-type N-terminal cleavage/methylation domain-containing protein [Candidatus Saccharimonadales bacterium]